MRTGQNLLNKSDNVYNEEFLYLVCMIIIFLNLFSFLFYIILKLKELRKEHQALSERYIKTQREHFEYLENLDSKTKKFRHDFKNHINVLRLLINNERYSEAKAYLEEFSKKTTEIIFKYSTGNKLVDAIFNEKLNVFFEKDIYFDKDRLEIIIEGSFSDNINITDFDICTIFSNVLDNIFEALMRINNDKVNLIIKINIKCEKEFCLVEILNSSEPFKDNVLTSKEDYEEHGIGMGNIRETLEKYSGSIELTYDEKREIAIANIFFKAYNNISYL